MKSTNTLLITSDEHTRRASNCFGTSFLHTPHLDRLAERGTKFVNAYTNSPLCIPSRASFITGRYVHEIGCWDNCNGWDGSVEGWSHAVSRACHSCVSIGKLHYQRGHDLGFTRELYPMHLSNGGLGDGKGLLRREQVPYDSPERDYGLGEPISINGPKMMSDAIGRGDSNHSLYDRRITAAACDWLTSAESRQSERPWVLYVSFVSPHFPLIAPAEFYDLYDLGSIPEPLQYGPGERPDHPVVAAMRRIWNYDDYFDREKMLRARAAYYGLCSFLDHNIGLILRALEESGEAENTRIIYASDHGECLGNRGLWSTSAMYEESIGVPLIVSGPDVPKGHTVEDTVSLVDLYPTILQSAGVPQAEGDGRPGHSLIDIANGDVPVRTVLSEYHAGGSITGAFAIRHGRWKYVHYVGYPPQLFDLEADPDELHDLGTDPAFAAVRADCDASLRAVVDPEAADARAFADQAVHIQRHGGVEAIRERQYTWGGHSIDTRIERDGTLTQLTELPAFERYATPRGSRT